MAKAPALASINHPNAWRDTAFLPIARASEIAGISAGSLYNLNGAGRIEFKRLAGRTLVATPSLIALIDGAETWTASTRGTAGRAARASRARAARAE